MNTNNQSIAIVTGTSRGLGEAMALELLSRGIAVIAVARGQSQTLNQYASQHNVPLFNLQADLSDPESIIQACNNIKNHIPENLNHCLLINNAGMLGPVDNTANLTDIKGINKALMLNVGSVMQICSTVLEICLPNNVQTRILNISSGAGRNPMSGWAVYCATKAALDHYTRVLVQEQSSENIRIASLAPGVIDTQMQAEIRTSDQTAFPNLPNFINMHSSGQLADPTTIANKIIKHMLSNDFGNTTIDDIRNYS